MAIDIKELRVGSIVSIGGKMRRIAAIDALNRQIGIDAYTTDAKGVKRPFGYKIEDIEPIPITEELLTELGFEKRKERGSVSRWEHSTNMAITIWGERMELTIGDILAVEPVHYLHELEAFLYLTTKTELIKE